MGKEQQSFQQKMLGLLESYMQRNEVEPLSHNTRKNEVEMKGRPTCKGYDFKILRKKYE